MNNMPPGVTESMIPGNRPEDAAWEELYEWIDDMCDKHGIEPQVLRQIIDDGLFVKSRIAKMRNALEALYKWADQWKGGVRYKRSNEYCEAMDKAEEALSINGGAE